MSQRILHSTTLISILISQTNQVVSILISTNKSSLNTTMPEQLPPQSLNGSTVGKI
jgi:hypothetical protein